MKRITYMFEPMGPPINGRHIHAKGLHGLLYYMTGQTDLQESSWLHNYTKGNPKQPKPFNLVPLYTDKGTLAGMRLTALTERVATLFERTGEWFQRTERPCHLGQQGFIISDCWNQPGPNWSQLAMATPAKQMGLRFISPTSFKQGPAHMPLPLPGTVFLSPIRVWNAYAPKELPPLPEELQSWCAKNVFVTRHQIETVQVNNSKRDRFTGFVGDVWFKAYDNDETYLRCWQAMADLATFCGVGHKTTMGMGAVERI